MLGEICADAFISIDADAKRLLEVTKAKSGRGNKKQGTTQEARLKEALSLVARCRSHCVPPPKSVVKLLADCLGTLPLPAPADRKPRLTPNQWMVIKAISSKRSLNIMDFESNWPIKAPVEKISEETGISVRSIYKWKNNPDFWRGLVWLISEDLIADLSTPDDIQTEP